LPLIGQLQPVGSAALRAQAIARWKGFPRSVDTEIANLRAGIRSGYVVPAQNIREVIEQLDGLLGASDAESPFLGILGRDSTPEFRATIAAITRTQLRPAAQRYRTFLATTYLPRARKADGISAMTNGTACYRGRVRYYTTLLLEPKAIHQL